MVNSSPLSCNAVSQTPLMWYRGEGWPGAALEIEV